MNVNKKINQAVACAVNAAYGDPSPAGMPVSIGVPFPRGVLKEPFALAARSPSGERRPAAGRVLARHPDGLVRWCLVSFGAREAGPHEVEVAQAPTAPAPAVTLKTAGGVWTLDNGRLRLSVCETGPGVLGEPVGDGHPYLAAPADLWFAVDDASTRHETRRAVRVIEQSPLRVRLRVEGAHHRLGGGRCLDYRLDIEVWAGWSAVRLDYHYFNLEPGQPSQTIRKIAFESAWNLGEATERHFIQRSHGLFYVSRHVFNPEPVAGAAIRLGIWNLLQLPTPGEMLIPTLSAGRPRFVFGSAAADELTVAPRLVRWKMGGDGDSAKISLQAAALTGRAGYLRRTPAAGLWDLVVREFAVDPKGDYVEALWEPPYETGWGFQACCVRTGVECFNELEYHAPAVTATAGINRGRDESRVWAFRGPAAAVADAAAVLLGQTAETIIMRN